MADNGNYRESRYFTAYRNNNSTQSQELLLPPMVQQRLDQRVAPFGLSYLRFNDGTTIGCESCEELWTPNATHIDLALRGVEVIGNGSGSHHELRKLDLGQQSFKSDEMIDMAAIEFEGSTLTELNLSSNNFQDGDIANLSARLESDHSIQKLFLNDNGITDQGIRVLASAIPEMKGLKEIWLYDNRFSSEAAESLIDATRVNYDLERVYIAKSSHHSLMEVQKHVDYNLCLNKGGRRLLKAQNICPSLWPLVFERAIKMLRWGAYVNGKRAQADVIFYLLHGPALLERNDENF